MQLGLDSTCMLIINLGKKQSSWKGPCCQETLGTFMAASLFTTVPMHVLPVTIAAVDGWVEKLLFPRCTRCTTINCSYAGEATPKLHIDPFILNLH